MFRPTRDPVNFRPRHALTLGTFDATAMSLVTPPQQLVVHSSDPGHFIAGFNPLLMVCFRRAPKSHEISLIEEIVRAGLEAGIRGGLLYVVAREDFQGGVDPQLRTTLERITRTASPHSGESAVVILTRGFGGAVARGVLAGLLLLSHERTKVRVFKSPNEACDWLSGAYNLNGKSLRSAWESCERGAAETAVFGR